MLRNRCCAGRWRLEADCRSRDRDAVLIIMEILEKSVPDKERVVEK